MPSKIALPDGRSFVHCTYSEVTAEVDRSFGGPHDPIDCAAPRRNLCRLANKQHEAEVGRAHEEAMPSDVRAPLAPSGGNLPDTP